MLPTVLMYVRMCVNCFYFIYVEYHSQIRSCNCQLYVLDYKVVGDRFSVSHVNFSLSLSEKNRTLSLLVLAKPGQTINSVHTILNCYDETLNNILPLLHGQIYRMLAAWT